MLVLNLVLNVLVEEIGYDLYCLEMVEDSYKRSQPVYNPDWTFEDVQG
jgi:hypothetical protein